jgi:tetratricopeptide (TPR) repeat protein
VTRLLAFIVVVELAVGAMLALGRWQQSVPPVPDLTLVDSLAAGQLVEQARACRTPAGWRALGEAYMSVGYFPEAEVCHRVAAEHEPENATFVYEWAFALERLGRTSEAAEQFGRAVDLGHPRPADCRFNVGRCRLREEDVGAARAAFESARATPMARYELARLAYREGDMDGARRELDSLLAEYPDAIQPAVLRHRIAHRQGDGRLAFQTADQADRARRRLPNPFESDSERLIAAHKRLGVKAKWAEVEALVQTGELDRALPIITPAADVRWHPAGADVLAEIRFRGGDPAGALEQFQIIESRTGPVFPHLARLGDTWMAIGEHEKARAAWTRAVALGSVLETKDVHYKLAESYRKAGDTRRADSHMVRSLIAAGVEATRRGAMNDARILYQEALRIDPESPTVWFRVGELARALDQRSEAIRAYEACLARDPNHGRAAAGLAAAQGK